MKTPRNRMIATLGLLATLALAGTASAEGHGHGHGHGRWDGDAEYAHDNGRHEGWYKHDRDDRDRDDRDRDDWRDRDDRDDDRWRREHWHHAHPVYVHDYGHWRRGYRYRGPVYVVHEYDRYDLRRPPRGYHWVRDDDTFLLVAIGTGVILDIALH